MPVAEGFFDYRPDIITSTGQRKPSGFEGNSITGEIPIAQWDTRSEAYVLLDVAPAPRTTAPTATSGTPTAVYEEPKIQESKIPKMLMVSIIPLALLVIIGAFALKRFKRG